MYKLTINPHAEGQVYLLPSGKSLLLSQTRSRACDIWVEEPAMGSDQLLIESLDGSCMAANLNGSSTITINGEPLARRRLHSFDILSANGLMLLFEHSGEEDNLLFEEDDSSEVTSGRHGSSSLYVLNAALGSAHLEDEAIDLDWVELELLAREPRQSYEQEVAPDGVDPIQALLDEVAALGWDREEMAERRSKGAYSASELVASDSFVALEKPLPVGAMAPVELPKVSLEELAEEEAVLPAYLQGGWEEEVISTGKTASFERMVQPKLPRSFSWQKGLFFGFVCLMVFALLVGSFLFHVRERRQKDELQVARGLSDIAMALSYAHINGIRPQQQNWADPAFLKKNLAAVLSPRYPILAALDSQGQLTNSPYLLRVYTNHQLSQFLVMAQPVASLSQWIAPRSALVIDSKQMELRKLSDVREINRLLVNQRPLEGDSALEISALVAEGSLIPLEKLGSSHSHMGFMAPRTLMMIDPLAGDRIYNAPRYFLFGQRLLERAIVAAASQAPHERELVSEELNGVAKLPHLVLYATESLQKAHEAQYALAQLLPQHRFQVGYLKISPEGKVVSSQLLLKSDIGLDPQLDVASATDSLLPAYSTQAGNDPEPATQEPLVHPFAQRLAEIAEQRRAALLEGGGLALQIELESHLARPDPQFVAQLTSLVHQMDQTEKLLEPQLIQQLEQLLLEYDQEPIEQLWQMIQEVGLAYLLAPSIDKELSSVDRAPLLQEVEGLLLQIEQSQRLPELYLLTAKTSALLSWQQLPDLLQLADYQRKLLDCVLNSLSSLLLKPGLEIDQQKGSEEEGRLLIRQILTSARLFDREIEKYFLEEWNNLISEHIHSDSYKEVNSFSNPPDETSSQQLTESDTATMQNLSVRSVEGCFSLPAPTCSSKK